jgi:hypothetical protein
MTRNDTGIDARKMRNDIMHEIPSDYQNKPAFVNEIIQVILFVFVMLMESLMDWM